MKQLWSVRLVVAATAPTYTIRLGPARPSASSSPDVTFAEFAEEWFERHRRTVREASADAIEWRLRFGLLPFFGQQRLSEIDAQTVDRYQLAQIRERERLDRLRGAGVTTERRPISNATINRFVALLGQILDQAVDYELISANPARGKRRRLKCPKPPRTSLDSADQIEALLDAAAGLDRRSASAYRHIGRRPILATLVFGGLRIGELLGLRWRDVDFGQCWIHVGQAKTDAGLRRVRLRPALSRELSAHKFATAYRAPADLVFATSTGSRHSPSNIRLRVVERSRVAASDRLERTGRGELPHLTPHSLRRTFASLLYALGEPPTIVMAEMGHASPALALSIYASVMRRSEGEAESLRRLMA